MWTHTKESQAKITPKTALTYLKEGNLRFCNNLKIDRNLLKQVNQTSTGQFPFAVILSCIDSRTSAELIFDQGLGDVFSIRIAGNILNDDILGSMEYACQVAKSKLIVVLGHTRCAAITSACSNFSMGHFTGLLKKIEPAIQMISNDGGKNKKVTLEYIDQVSAANINLTIQQIHKQSTILSALVASDELEIVGGLYNVETGYVDFFKN